jgi:hypothetical protein
VPFLVGFSALGMLETPDRIALSSLEHSKGSFRHDDLIEIHPIFIKGFPLLGILLMRDENSPLSLVENSPILYFVNLKQFKLIDSLRLPVDVWKKE